MCDLGVYLATNNVYSCSFSHAKRSFYRSFNAIFGIVGPVASEEVVVELMKKKYLSILYYAMGICHLNKAHINYLDYAIGICFGKIFCIKSRETIMRLLPVGHRRYCNYSVGDFEFFSPRKGDSIHRLA